MFKKTLLNLLIFIVSYSFSQNQSENNIIQKYLLENKFDSLKIILNKLPQSKERENILKVVSNKPTYDDFVYFLQTNTFNNKNDLKKLNDFLDRKVKTPSNLDKINLDFVRIKWHQINQLLENEQINLAATETKSLENYIAKFNNKSNDIDYKKALIYAKQYEIILCLIKQDIKKGKNLCVSNLIIAKNLNDKFLILYLNNFLKEFLIYEKHIEGYLKICREVTKIENSTEEKSVFYIQNIQDYLDASIFKGNFNEIEIENLLNKIYSYKNSKQYSYMFYAKYLAYSDPNSKACSRIYKRFNVKNFSGLYSYFIKDAKNNLNSNELLKLYIESADVFYNHKNFQRAANVQDTISMLTRKIYSKELSQSIADYETKEKDFENLKLKQVNQEKIAELFKQKIIIIVVSVTLLLFSILSYFLYNTIKQSNRNSEKLETANKDLNRLNILNQKLFTVISHDFKTPIATLRYLLKKNTDNNPFINEISLQLELSDNMLQGLLDWAKSELNNAVTVQNLDLNNLIQIVIKETENQACAKNIQIFQNIAYQKYIQFPESVLKIVLRNIVNNAIKFSHQDGTIEINFVGNEILVRDYGKGFDIEKLDLIFNQQVASSLGTNYESGFGIGLYFSFEMMKRQGGNILIFPKDTGTLVAICFDKN